VRILVVSETADGLRMGGVLGGESEPAVDMRQEA
jgi:hypothetical protein